MKRFIEITAKSPEEAQEMVTRELHTDEKVTNAETLAAPVRGIFGVVGNPEFRMRFTIETVVAPEPPARPQSEEAYVAPVEAPEDDDADLDEVADHHEAAADDEEYGQPGDQENREARVHTSRKYSIEIVGDKHPAYQKIIGMVTKVAENVGVSELVLHERIEGDAWIIESAGGNVSQLIGKHGKTLDALQYIVNIVANKNIEEKKVKIVLDVQGYRDQRYKGLVQLANRMLRKVLDSGRPVELEPMSTVDRRTVHLTLKDRNGIETFSKGIEPMRRVVITPKKAAGRSSAPAGRSETSSGGGGGGGWRTGNSRPRPARGGDRPAPRRDDGPQKGRAVPMFLEEDASHDD
jgi:spoIIIJ-associated protein